MSDVKPFEAEVSRVLDLVINSLYKERDIFLRELISNASDACDKVRYQSLSAPELLGDDPSLKISITADEEAGILQLSDNGIGMDHDDLAENLGTIARSGTARFLDQLSGEKPGDVSLIGQFGVGFYSVFMVADKVIVQSRKAGQEQAWLWASNGRDGYTLSEAEGAVPRGTMITLHLKEDAKEFLDEFRIRHVVRTYSDHIALPIMLEVHKKPDPDAEDSVTDEEENKASEPQTPEQINNASALWTRPKSEITEDQYREFYHHNAHAFDEPFARVHFSAEGMLSYTGLLFVPSMKPFDLYDPKRRHGVKLYVKRVFISDDLEELLPKYLRFVSGVVDSEDLQLNVSRETLQHGAIVSKMRKALVKRLLDAIGKEAKLVEDDKDETTDDADELTPKKAGYLEFWADFGAVIKEGIYEDYDNRERILELARFKSTAQDGWTDLARYIEGMKEGQDAILYITGDDAESLRNSPQLEEAKAKGVDVLLLDDTVDEFWVQQVGTFKEKSFKSLTKGDVDLSSVAGEEVKKDEDEADQTDLDRLIAALKITIGDDVKDVRISKRLRDSAVCLVADDAGMDLQMERFLKQHNQLDKLSKRILEINGSHNLIKRMSEMAKADGDKPDLDELARLLLDQARIIEGETIPDPGAFSRRMSSFLARGLV